MLARKTIFAIRDLQVSPPVVPSLREIFAAFDQGASKGPDDAGAQNQADEDAEKAKSKTIPGEEDSNYADFADSHAVLDNQMDGQDFLNKYPKSLRREEVLYHMIRAQLFADKLDHDATEMAFAAYFKEFPDSHLKRGVTYMRAQYDEGQHRWRQAVEEYYQVIKQTIAPELHLDAAAHLSFIFDELNLDELRMEILNDIQKSPIARHALLEYVHCNELPRLTDFLVDKVKDN